MWVLMTALAVQSCPLIPDRFEVDRFPSERETYSEGSYLGNGYSLECSYFDTRGQCMLEDCGSVTFHNFSGRRKILSYDHYYDLSCSVEGIDYAVAQSDHPCLKVTTCTDGNRFTLTVRGVVWGSQSTTVSWEVLGHLRADLNNDGYVDGTDLGILFGYWGSDEADLNGDGQVDGQDIGVLLTQWT